MSKLRGKRKIEVQPYYLEQEVEVLKGQHLYLFCVSFNNVSEHIEDYVLEGFTKILEAGGLYCWVGFEGIFHFDFLFDDEFANQIYGVQFSGEKPALALNDRKLNSSSWRLFISQVRQRVYNFVV